MRIVIFIFFLASFFSGKAQTHAEEYYKYDCAYKSMEGYYNRGLYHKAVLYPDSLKENKYVNASTNYFCARVYALSNEFDKTLEYLEKAVKGGITNSQIDKMYDLDGFRESNLYIVYEMNYDKWYQAFLEKQNGLTLDTSYILSVKSINEKYLKNLREQSKKRGGNQKDSVNFYYKSNKVDSLCFLDLIELTLEKGFPTTKTIGKEYYWYSRILRYNMPDNYDFNCDDWTQIKKMIYVEIEKGTIYPFYYAAIEDRIRLGSKQPQLYGTMTVIHRTSKDGINSIQYENPEELNIRRRAIGLCSIQLEMWSEARELPKSLKRIEFK